MAFINLLEYLMQNPTPIEIKQAIDSNTRLLKEVLSRSARIETRLTQLMLFEGMQSDGRQALDMAPRRGNTYVG